MELRAVTWTWSTRFVPANSARVRRQTDMEIYSHIRMEAKRAALELILKGHARATMQPEAGQDSAVAPTATQQIEGEYPQKSPQSGDFAAASHRKQARKPLKRIGSSGRTRTCNPSVNSRMLYH